MARLYTEHDIAAGRLVALNANQAHYLRTVMRAGPGDCVTLFNGRDGEWAARIESIGKKSGTLLAQHRLREQMAEPGPDLYFAPVKRAPLDFLVQKAVELGVAALQPVMTERTVVGRVNHGRLRAHIVDAAEQCERLSIPDLRAAIKYTMLLDNWPADRHLLICVERGAAPAIDSVLKDTGNIESRDIFIGPEGGLRNPNAICSPHCHMLRPPALVRASFARKARRWRRSFAGRWRMTPGRANPIITGINHLCPHR